METEEKQRKEKENEMRKRKVMTTYLGPVDTVQEG
jgi:hypothetical protein